MTEPETDETERIALIKRKCDNCEHIAVPLAGIGEVCEGCIRGRYRERVGIVQYEAPPETVAELRENFPEAVADGE